MTKIIGLHGKAGAGKDTVADHLVAKYGFIKLGFADPLYEMVRAVAMRSVSFLKDRAFKEEPIDWLGKSPRELLQTLGTEWGRSVDEKLWIKHLGLRMKFYAGNTEVQGFVIPDVRFPNEADWVKAHQESELWHIARDAPTITLSRHPSETQTIECDQALFNNGSIEELLNVVDSILGDK